MHLHLAFFSFSSFHVLVCLFLLFSCSSLCIYTDLRDRLGFCVPADFEPILDDLTQRWNALSVDEQNRLLLTVPVWYHRHIPTAAQLEAQEAKRLQKEKEQKEREEAEEEDGICGGCMWGEEEEA